jgi:hypothetical protein
MENETMTAKDFRRESEYECEILIRQRRMDFLTRRIAEQERVSLQWEHELFYRHFQFTIGRLWKQVQGEQAKVRFCEHRLGEIQDKRRRIEANRLALQMSIGREQEETGERHCIASISAMCRPQPQRSVTSELLDSRVVTQGQRAKVVLDPEPEMVKPSNASSIQISLFDAPELVTVTPPQAVVEVVASPHPIVQSAQPSAPQPSRQETVQPSESEHSADCGAPEEAADEAESAADDPQAVEAAESEQPVSEEKEEAEEEGDDSAQVADASPKARIKPQPYKHHKYKGKKSKSKRHRR